MITPRITKTGTALGGAAMLSLVTGCGFLLSLIGATPDAGPTMNAQISRFAGGFAAPVGMAVPDDDSGRLFVVDQLGLIHVLDSQGNRLGPHFLDVRDRMIAIGIDFGNGVIFDERGLLSLAFHPQYAANGRFFVTYNASKDAEDPEGFDCELRVSEFRVSASDINQADPGSERVLMDIDKPQFNHNGGQLAFGPDGYLYIGVGDGGGGDDAETGHTPNIGNAQDGSKVLGKILRIDVDSGDPYGIPQDNPFVDEADYRGEIWALGVRNPWRFSFDQGGDHRLFVGDVGQNLHEEIDIVARGDNCGWNLREGVHCFSPQHPSIPAGNCDDTDAAGRSLRAPIIEQSHESGGISIIGGFVYRGDVAPDLAGQYVFAQWSTVFSSGNGRLFAASESASGEWTVTELKTPGRPDERMGRYILGLGQDREGEVYILTSGNVGPTGETGEIYKIEAAG